MSKYCLILVLALFAGATSVQATGTEDKDMANNFADYVVQVLDSDYNWFAQNDLIEILTGATQLLNQSYSFNDGLFWGFNESGGAYQSYEGDIWHPCAGSITSNFGSNASIQETSAVVQTMRNLIGANGPPGFEAIAQQTLGEGNEIRMMGTTTETQSLQTASNFDYSSSITHSHDLYFIGREITWPDPATAAVGNNAQFRIIANENTAYTFHFAGTQSPLVLDMDGDGKLEASAGEWLPHQLKNSAKLISFDMDCDGFDDLTEWVGPNDGLLLVYSGGEVTAENLFGNEGGAYKNGYEKLSLLDTNRDGKITGDELNTLSVWQDKNGNAKVDQGEVASVASLGITELQLNHRHMVSSFIQNGTRKNMWDWYPCVAPVKKHHR